MDNGLELFEQNELDNLRFHYGEAYNIWHFPAGKWMALHKHDGPALEADGAQELRELLRADYQERGNDRG